MFSVIDPNTDPDPAALLNVMKFFPIIILIGSGAFFGWFWSVAIGLQKKVPNNITMKTKKFKIFFFIPIVYLLSIFILFGTIFSGLILEGTVPNEEWGLVIFPIILPLHLLSMFGIFYSMYFVAKTIKTVELQKEVGFSEFAGEFFMIWFYFVGIWILQPKINKMVENEDLTAKAF